MTYKEIYEKAANMLDRGEITLGDFDKMVEPLNSEVQSEPHWIPVTERLPESKEEDLEYPTVLICFENEEIMLGCFYESTKEWGTGEYFDKKCDPIAWMPLPEPYKEVNT